MLSVIKDKIDDWKIKNLAKQVVQLREEKEKLEQQLTKLQAGKITEASETIGDDTVINFGDDNIKKHIDKNTPNELYKRETSHNETRKKETIKKMKSNSEKKESCLKQVRKTHVMNKLQRKKMRKRCHFCRKRGHIQRECPGRKMIWNWLWDDTNER